MKNRGIILCVCSKNNEPAAKEPFEKHPEMVLKLEDISVFVANWEDKAGNIRHIQSVLNIGMDSLVFLDDNPFEREVVRSLIPNITVPELPENPEEYVDYLRSLNLFETASYSEEDKVRTQQYRAEAQRVSLQSQCADYDAYLEGLEMIAEAKPFDSFHFPRIAQLTQRSNQFNLRTVRYTEQEITDIAHDERYITLYFTLKDKFGDHGLISAVIMEKQDGKLFVNTWLMSCRVLKRGMEEFIVNKMVSAAREAGFETVEGEYLKTAKNAMVANIYEKLGFEKRSDTQFIANTHTFVPNKTHIKEDI
jgi:FkbH-like protein